MEQTSLQIAGRRPPGQGRERQQRQRPDPQLVERIALVAQVLAPTRASALFEGLSEPEGRQAGIVAEKLEVASSPERHARLAMAFGPREEGASELRELVALASPRLARELIEAAPPHVRPSAPAGAPGSPRLVRLARRLVREALR